MRHKTATIPSDFLALDTNVTAADRVVNARDLHAFRRNHNFNLARRVRKDLFGQRIADGIGGINKGAEFKSRYDPDGSAMSRILSIPIFITQLTKELGFWTTGTKSQMDAESTLDEDSLLYITLREPHVWYDDITANTITVNVTYGAATRFGSTIAVPDLSGEHTLHYGRVPFILEMHLKSFIDTTRTIASATAIVDIGSNWFVSATLINQFDHVECSLTTIEPRMVVDRKTLPGGNYKYIVDLPWNVVPDPATETLTFREIQGVYLTDYGASEVPISDFEEDLTP